MDVYRIWLGQAHGPRGKMKWKWNTCTNFSGVFHVKTPEIKLFLCNGVGLYIRRVCVLVCAQHFTLPVK